MTYLTIYHIAQDYIDFVNIIDGPQLNLDHEILISDFDVSTDGAILVNDLRKNQIHFVQYSLPNEIKKVHTWTPNHPIYEIEITGANTILIATGTYVT